MKLNFFEKKIPALGLDISGSAIKMIQFTSTGGKTSIKGFVDIELPKGVILDDNIADPETLVYLIKNNLEKPSFGRIDTRHVIASLPESKSFVRVIQIPEMSEVEIENAIMFEAENYIPIPMDQVYLDWQQVGKSGGKLDVLIIASPREHADRYLSVLDKAGLRPMALEVESQSVVRSLIEPKAIETTLIVDLDAFRSNLIMVERGTLSFTSSIPIAGNSFTEAISKALGVSSAKAEDIKKMTGIANTPEYPNLKIALLPVLNNLSAEIKNILAFHQEHSPSKVTSLVLCGGTSKLSHLDEFLRPEFADIPDFKVSLANPWTNLKAVDTKAMPPLEALGFTTAIGLAARNLL